MFEAFHQLERWKLALAASAIWLALLSPTILNGVPFLYFDSENYITRPMNAMASVARRVAATVPDDGALKPDAARAENQSISDDGPLLDGQPATPEQMIFRGRSIHYGLFAWAGLWAGGFWGVVVLQGAMTAAVIVSVARRLRLRMVTVLALTIMAVSLTPAGIFVGLIMPDFMAPLTVATLALLLLDTGGMTWRERMLIMAIAVLGMISHNSHLALGATIVVVAGVSHVLGLLHHTPARRGLILALGTIGVAVVINIGTDQIARHLIRVEMVDRPFFSAHLLDEGGPGTAFLAKQCSADPDRFQLCGYRDRFPLEWRQFLFDSTAGIGVFAAKDIPHADRRRISAEDKAFALAVFRDRPVEVLHYASTDFLEQLARFTVEPTPVGEDALSWMRVRMPVFLAVAPAAQGGNVNYVMLQNIDRAAKLFALFSLLGIVAALALRLNRSASILLMDRMALDRWAFGMLLLWGLVLNAAICGILASPYDRFQARVIVLLPLGAACLLAAVFGRNVCEGERIA